MVPHLTVRSAGDERYLRAAHRQPQTRSKERKKNNMTTEKTTPATLAAALRTARVKRDSLASATDALNAKIAAAERAIAELKLGVPGYYELSRNEENHVSILFTKHERQWRLMWGRGSDLYPDWDEFAPLCQAPRHVRLQAIRALPQLVMQMVDAMDDEIEDVKQRSDDLDRFVAELAASTQTQSSEDKKGGGK